jgi:hypothetical protein
MKASTPIGVLGMTDEERAELKRTKKWPTRQVETPEGPVGLSLTSLPSHEYLRGYLRGYSDALGKPRPRGRRSEIDKWVTTAAECLRDTGGRIEEARKLYITRSTLAKDTASRQFTRGLKFLQALWDSD